MLCGHGETTANLVADPQTATETEQTYFGGYTQPTTLVATPDNLCQQYVICRSTWFRYIYSTA